MGVLPPPPSKHENPLKDYLQEQREAFEYAQGIVRQMTSSTKRVSVNTTSAPSTEEAKIAQVSQNALQNKTL